MSKKYEVIYADPPWRYSFSKSKSREIENQYPTMSVNEICALDVPSEKNSVLYLWTTAPKLIEGLQVMKAWGFTYKSQAIWDKEVMGMGYWFRGQHEILLVGTKGKFSPPPQELRKSSMFRVKRSKHSKKPDEIRDLIASWFPDNTKLEMFARMSPEGWDTWGNEIETDVEMLTKNVEISEVEDLQIEEIEEIEEFEILQAEVKKINNDSDDFWD
jgi:N6-adenosine-specific RNA methylase IME4